MSTAKPITMTSASESNRPVMQHRAALALEAESCGADHLGRPRFQDASVAIDRGARPPMHDDGPEVSKEGQGADRERGS